MDTATFDIPAALECRGITFDKFGAVVSRPLHKFFNVGEKEETQPHKLLGRTDIAAVFEKLDGSMIATAFVDGELLWRSKKSFNSEVVKLAKEHLARPENASISRFAHEVASQGLTAIFELTHPKARIVVAQDQPQLRLLHVRDNLSGAYVMLDRQHPVHDLIAEHAVPRFDGLTMPELMASLETMTDCEGYVVQFANGDMVKIKCPWYLRLHRSLTRLRERDIAELALAEKLDDLKSTLAEVGFDLTGVNEVETKLRNILATYLAEVDSLYEKNSHLSQKDFAILFKEHPLFGMLMQRYTGREIRFAEWYSRNHLKNDFSLRNLTNEAMTEAIEG